MDVQNVLLPNLTEQMSEGSYSLQIYFTYRSGRETKDNVWRGGGPLKKTEKMIG